MTPAANAILNTEIQMSLLSETDNLLLLGPKAAVFLNHKSDTEYTFDTIIITSIKTIKIEL